MGEYYYFFYVVMLFALKKAPIGFVLTCSVCSFIVVLIWHRPTWCIDNTRAHFQSFLVSQCISVVYTVMPVFKKINK